MKPFVRYAILFTFTLLACVHSSAQSTGKKSSDERPERKIWIKLRSGETLTGVLQKVDQDSVDFTVKGILQTVSLDDVETISFGGGGASARPTLSTKPAVEQPRITTVPKKPGPTPRSMVEPAPSTSQTIYPMTASLKPTITFREKARYTEEARSAGTQGTVVLQLIFNANGSISNIRVVQGLPHGLTDSAIDAAKKIRFDPATKDGRPVSVRGNLEYTFNP